MCEIAELRKLIEHSTHQSIHPDPFDYEYVRYELVDCSSYVCSCIGGSNSVVIGKFLTILSWDGLAVQVTGNFPMARSNSEDLD